MRYKADTGRDAVVTEDIEYLVAEDTEQLVNYVAIKEGYLEWLEEIAEKWLATH